MLHRAVGTLLLFFLATLVGGVGAQETSSSDRAMAVPVSGLDDRIASGGRGVESHGTPVPVAPVPRDLPFFYDLYTFRGTGGETTVVAAIAVQVRRLRAERRSGAARAWGAP